MAGEKLRRAASRRDPPFCNKVHCRDREFNGYIYVSFVTCEALVDCRRGSRIRIEHFGNNFAVVVSGSHEYASCRCFDTIDLVILATEHVDLPFMVDLSPAIVQDSDGILSWGKTYASVSSKCCSSRSVVNFFSGTHSSFYVSKAGYSSRLLPMPNC